MISVNIWTVLEVRRRFDAASPPTLVAQTSASAPDGVALAPRHGRGLVIEERRRQSLARLPLHGVGQQTQEVVGAYPEFVAVMNRTDGRVYPLDGPKGALDLAGDARKRLLGGRRSGLTLASSLLGQQQGSRTGWRVRLGGCGATTACRS